MLGNMKFFISSIMTILILSPSLITLLPSSLAQDSSIVNGAIVQTGHKSIQLPQSQVYIFGMDTDGNFDSTSFQYGHLSSVRNLAGNVGSQIAFTTSNQNNFTTKTGNYSIGGVGIVGAKYYGFAYITGSDPEAGVNSTMFITLTSPALVVVAGMAGGQSSIAFHGLPGLQIDSEINNGSSGIMPLSIGHAYLDAGSYNITQSTASNCEACLHHNNTDLFSVFAFSQTKGGFTSSSISSFIATSPTISSSPEFGYVGKHVIITGTNFTVNSIATIQYDGINQTTTEINSTGGFTAMFTIPPSTNGKHQITVIDTNDNVASSELTVLSSNQAALVANDTAHTFTIVTFTSPSITLSPPNAGAGRVITITGIHFAPLHVITIKFDGIIPVVNPPSLKSDSTGAFTATFVVPSSATGGNHKVVVFSSGNAIP